MNPFDLPGPQFLGFYLVLGVAVCMAVYWLRRRSEAGEAIPVDARDPYLIAYLRGGAAEALRVATVSLIDRGLLEVSGKKVRAKGREARRPIESAVLAAFHAEANPWDIFSEPRCQAAAEVCGKQLQKLGLAPDETTRAARTGRLLLALAVLLGVAVVKISIAVQRGHSNVIFLVLLAVAFAIVAAVLSGAGRKRTRRGEASLAELKQRFAGLQERRQTVRSGGATSELVLLAGVFGIGALATLPGTSFAWVKDLFPKASAAFSGSGCGSSCGSSCGGGGSCGGGCGGGCGGCG